MQVRSLETKDYDAIMDLWVRSGLSSLRPLGRDSREAFVRQLGLGAATNGSGGQQTVLGLIDRDRLIGVVVATHDGRKGWINRLAVDPNYRRRGYARELIAAAENALTEQGMSVIAALIERENEASITLFQQAGYRLGEHICYLNKRDDDRA